MKKIIILTGLHLLAALACFGQTGAGNLLVGGSGHFNDREISRSFNDNWQQQSSYAFQLQGGKFIRDNLALGLKFQYSYSKSHNELVYDNLKRSSSNNGSSYSGGFFIRKYVAVTNKLFFYGQGSSSLIFMRHNQETSRNVPNLVTQSNTRGIVVDLSPGFTYLISPKVGLDLSNYGLSYGYYRNKEENFNAHSFNLGLDLKSLAYGLRFYFTR